MATNTEMELLAKAKLEIEQAVTEILNKHGLRNLQTDWQTDKPSSMIQGFPEEPKNYLKIDIAIKKH